MVWSPAHSRKSLGRKVALAASGDHPPTAKEFRIVYYGNARLMARRRHSAGLNKEARKQRQWVALWRAPQNFCWRLGLRAVSGKDCGGQKLWWAVEALAANRSADVASLNLAGRQSSRPLPPGRPARLLILAAPNTEISMAHHSLLPTLDTPPGPKYARVGDSASTFLVAVWLRAGIGTPAKLVLRSAASASSNNSPKVVGTHLSTSILLIYSAPSCYRLSPTA